MYWQTNLNPVDFFKNDIELKLTHHSGKISCSLLEMKVVTSMMMRYRNVLVSAYLIDSYLELLSNLFFWYCSYWVIQLWHNCVSYHCYSFDGIVHFGNTRGNPHTETYAPFQNVTWIHSSTGPGKKKGNRCPLAASFILWMCYLPCEKLSIFA